MSLLFNFMAFCREKHRGQVRKYTGEPYVSHLAEVAAISATVFVGRNDFEKLQCIAWGHDLIEDQRVEWLEFFRLDRYMGPRIYEGILWLTDLEIGNRAQRKEAARVRLAHAPAEIQTIKLADLISNTASIVAHDPGFAEVYLKEKRALLESMTKGDPRLHAIAMEQLNEGERALERIKNAQHS